MAIKITKPQVNVREKLIELDYGHVPYHKMPAGSVIQTQFTILTGSGTSNEAETTSSTYQQTNHTVTISPKFKNSIIRIDMAANTKQNSGSAYHTLAIYKNIAGRGWEFGTKAAFGSTISTAPHGLGTIRHNGTSTTWNIHPILFFDKPNTTETIEYRLFHRNSSNGSYTVRVGENSADEFCSAMEIKQ